LDAYNATLHKAVRSDFPSMKELYGRLSEALHLADESVELFEKAIDDIKSHFKAVQLYKELKKA
jgi:archaellum component FlaC